MTLDETIKKIRPLCEDSMRAAEKRFQTLAIPLGSLGLLEDAVVQLAGIQRTVKPTIERRAAVVFCADNGVVAQGVTQCGSEVTATVAENMNDGVSAVCLMSARLGIDVFPVDIGVAREVRGENIIRRKLMPGTYDMTERPAIPRDICVKAIETGIEMAEMCAEKGFGILCAGEMGIGNTTTTAAVTAAFLELPPEEVVGRGAGLSSEGLARKTDAVRRALALHRPDPSDPVDVLSKVGGLDIAGMTGLFLGGALCGVPVVMDGVISTVSALAAVRLCPLVNGYILPSHCSAEPAGARLLDALGAKPFLTTGMRLGEGTGAVAAVGLLDLALEVYHKMASFDDAGIEAYQPLT